MKQYLTQYPIAETAATAAIGACAAVGLTFLVPDPTWREHSGLTVPLLATALTFVLMFIERHFQERGHRMGANQAYVDSTTGLPSPRVAQHTLAAEFAAAERGRPLIVVLFSFDQFTRFSAKHGGTAASRLLLSVGRVLKRRTRGMNLSARHSTEGVFISILSGVPLEGADTYARRVHKDLTSLEVAGETQIVSIGIAVFEPHMHSHQDLLASAHRALSVARKNGGNRIIVDGEAEAPTGAR